jgi:hypothetical protein
MWCDMTAFAYHLWRSESVADQKYHESQEFNMLNFCAATEHVPDRRKPFAVDLNLVTTSCDHPKVYPFQLTNQWAAFLYPNMGTAILNKSHDRLPELNDTLDAVPWVTWTRLRFSVSRCAHSQFCDLNMFTSPDADCSVAVQAIVGGTWHQHKRLKTYSGKG